ncbi:MAG: Uma2 family endonuclease [Labilithrix sp.]|nr:Uma2 family endonuclease [Labilithrix sp.]
MAHVAPHRLSFDDYLRIEEDSGTKHEFVDGQVFAMSGGTPEHAGIAANITALLAAALRGQPCRVFSSDLRVRVRETGLGTYPDVTVICGKVDVDPDDPKGHTAVNPCLLVEVLSPSTEDYDRGEKLGNYKRIPSLEEIILVAHDRREVEIVRREGDGSWSRHIARDGDSVKLVSLGREGCELPVAEIYRDPLAP